MKSIKSKAPAKINLALEVVKKMANGFHEIRTVMVKMENVFDEIAIEFRPDRKGISIKSGSKIIPCDEKNICWRAAKAYFLKIKKQIGIVIKIEKKIPVGAGLGGGSTDGAAVLKILNKYYKNKLSAQELSKIASRVGKDIPFFLSSKKAAYLDKMGDRIRKTYNLSGLNFLLINPGIHISTPWAYAEVDKNKKIGNKGLALKMSRYLEAGKVEKIIPVICNDFEIAIEKKYPVILEIKKALLGLGADGSLMTGSGSSVFGIFKDKKETAEARKIMRKKYPNFFVEIG